jgi:hypothetical protein
MQDCLEHNLRLPDFRSSVMQYVEPVLPKLAYRNLVLM